MSTVDKSSLILDSNQILDISSIVTMY